MKIIIKLGDVSSNKRIKYPTKKLDEIGREKNRMYDFLFDADDCIIEDVDEFLLYALNVGIMAFNVKDAIHSDNEEKVDVPMYNPHFYRVFGIQLDGKEISIQGEDGTISINYFNKLMGTIMDDFYYCLNFINN